jgi:hypothetical protein
MPYNLRKPKDANEMVPPISQGSDDTNNNEIDNDASVNTSNSTENPINQENLNMNIDDQMSDDEVEHTNYFWSGNPPAQDGTSD